MDTRKLAFRKVFGFDPNESVKTMSWAELHENRKKIRAAVSALLDRIDQEQRAGTTDEEDLADSFARDLLRNIDDEFDLRDCHNTKDPINLDIKRTIVNPLPDEARLTTPNVATRVARPGRETRCEDIRGFRTRPDVLTPADFLGRLLSRRWDPDLDTYRIERRGTAIGAGPTGGYAVPELLRISIYNNMLESGGLFAKVNKEFAEGTDSLHVSTLDCTDFDSNGIGGFSRATFVGEGMTVPEATNSWRQRTWTLKKLITSTRFTLESVAAGGDALTNAVSDAISRSLVWAVERALLQGDIPHVGSLIDHASVYQYSRAGANQITFNDVVGMVSYCRPTKGSFWIASQSVIPQLAAMTDAGGHAVWLGNNSFDGATGAIPSTLLGYPVYFNLGISPTLGNSGDLVLFSDPSDWLKLVMFQDIVLQTSDSAYWTTGEIGMRVYMLTDMGPLPHQLITFEGRSYGFAVALKA